MSVRSNIAFLLKSDIKSYLNVLLSSNSPFNFIERKRSCLNRLICVQYPTFRDLPPTPHHPKTGVNIVCWILPSDGLIPAISDRNVRTKYLKRICKNCTATFWKSPKNGLKRSGPVLNFRSESYHDGNLNSKMLRCKLCN